MMKIKAIKLISILMLVITPLSIAFQQTLAQDTQPMYVHLSWQHDTTTTMTVMWRTIDETLSIVQYGADDSYGEEETADTGKWHEVELTELTPDSIYHYRVGNGETWSKDYKFKTGTTGEHTSFVAWGDSRHNRQDRKDIMRTVNSLEHDFTIFSGDFVDEGSELSHWYEWFEDFSPYLNHIPLMGVMGSHEENHTNYYDFFALPGKEEDYSFNYGPIHFICIHSEMRYYGVTFNDTVDWLLDDLETHKSYKWKIVLQHNPAYASSSHYHNGDFDGIISNLVPIYEEYNISMVIAGHNHMYERLQKNNITYVVAGGAGAPLYAVVPEYKLNESIYRESTYHAVLLDVFENQIDMRAFRTDKSLMDQYTINTEDKPDLRCNNLPFTNKISKGENQDITVSIMNIGEQDITEDTVAKIEISNGETWNIDVPPLDVYESVDFTYEWKATDKELYTWTVTTDLENQIDEVVEDNNQVEFYLDASEPDGTGFFAEGIWGVIASLSTIMLVIVIKRRRRR
ncbi:MAG: fibronectin type III domain-containing protein [Candidatus Heimdallarchaeaceae archaeon]|jgi:predicted phosphodiesterase